MTKAYPEIEQVLKYIKAHLCDSVTLSDLANQAGYSRYHFNRIFKETIGLPPLYYISALRLQMAKDLLLNTNLRVRDIGMEIGQQSLGTFTTRFTEKVGMTPAQFRNTVTKASQHLRSLQHLRDWTDLGNFSNSIPNINGTINATEQFEGVILIGLFPKPIPEGYPLNGTLVSSLGKFSIKGVEPGVYYLFATSVSWEMAAQDFMLPHKTLRSRSKKPIIVEPESEVPHQKVTLRPPHIEDSPILISLPLLMNNFLNRIKHHSN
ncbi:helix-turn-helix transcriptional regulator [Guptibacillus hwajinpoensis]|uniref:Transcriptional regulator n=1 Tax=Guptibacillus hwajinpoensis TaxID=208199 RepID=A0A0J6D4M6_9BACL|nr:AraC family transcriptional regulator [Alkalihalobacillus macyae]KMM39269.1 transcriptional regulator [Alkalihalobacillus macyae]